MEGPSLLLAASRLKPFKNKIVRMVGGNTHIGKERMDQQKILDIFAWGKHLVFQFKDFALRIHFMLYGSYEATIKGIKVTGDYPTKNRPQRLQLIFANGQIDTYNCSLRYLETAHAHDEYDFSIDIMSEEWDPKKALKQLLDQPESQIADVLLDQTVFAGVGNIIKNEVLYLAKVAPTTLVKALSKPKMREVIKHAQEFSHQFYIWREQFVLKQHFQIYRKSICPRCNHKLTRKKTGQRERVSFYCSICQK